MTPTSVAKCQYSSQKTGHWLLCWTLTKKLPYEMYCKAARESFANVDR